MLVASAIVLAAAYYYFQQSFAQASFADVSGVSASDFIAYRDATGFEVDYPYYFSVNSTVDESLGNSTQFFATYDGQPELMQIAVLAGTPEEIKNAVGATLTESERRTLRQGEAFGVQAIQFETQNYLGDFYLRHYFFPCGSKTGVVTAFVPKTRQQTLRTFAYSASTFKCVPQQ